MKVSFFDISGIKVSFLNINYREEMKHIEIFDIEAGETKTINTPVPTEPYNVEFIDSEGNIITTGLQQVSLSKVENCYDVIVYSTDRLTGVKLKILY